MREADLEADVKYLTTVWDDIQIKKDQVRAPAMLYQEPELALRVIRDFTTPETKRIVIDSADVHRQMKTFIDDFIAEPKPNLEHYTKAEPIFDHFGTEAVIDTNLGRKVWLKSRRLPDHRSERGADRDRREHGALMSASATSRRPCFKHEPRGRASEVVNQLRFRNIGGLIIIDLIDMDIGGAPRQGLQARCKEALKGRQGAKHEHPEDLRARARRDDAQAHAREPGADPLRAVLALRGQAATCSRDESMVAYNILREIKQATCRASAGRKIAITVSPPRRRAAAVRRAGRKPLARALRASSVGRSRSARARADLHQEQFEIDRPRRGGGPSRSRCAGSATRLEDRRRGGGREGREGEGPQERPGQAPRPVAGTRARAQGRRRRPKRREDDSRPRRTPSCRRRIAAARRTRTPCRRRPPEGTSRDPDAEDGLAAQVPGDDRARGAPKRRPPRRPPPIPEGEEAPGRWTAAEHRSLEPSPSAGPRSPSRSAAKIRPGRSRRRARRRGVRRPSRRFRQRPIRPGRAERRAGARSPSSAPRRGAGGQRRKRLTVRSGICG